MTNFSKDQLDKIRTLLDKFGVKPECLACKQGMMVLDRGQWTTWCESLAVIPKTAGRSCAWLGMSGKAWPVGEHELEFREGVGALVCALLHGPNGPLTPVAVGNRLELSLHSHLTDAAQARMGFPALRLPERVVLVVDDEDLVRRMTTRALSDAGFRVLEAHDGEEAATLLATLGTNVVGLIVSDIRMPRLDGLQLAALVSQRWPTVPLILMSGQGGPPAGYSGPFCAKPFTPETLIGAVTAFVGRAF